MTVEDLNTILLSENSKNVEIEITKDDKVVVHVNQKVVGEVENLLDLPREILHMKDRNDL